MDFLTKFELSILPAKRQVLHAASGRTLTQASKNSFDNPWSSETAAAVAALPPQVQKLLEEFPTLLRPNAAQPKPLHGVVHHIDTGSAAPVFARWYPETSDNRFLNTSTGPLTLAGGRLAASSHPGMFGKASLQMSRPGQRPAWTASGPKFTATSRYHRNTSQSQHAVSATSMLTW